MNIESSLFKAGFEDKSKVQEYGKERGLLEEGEKTEKIISNLEKYEDEFGYNPFKVEAFKTMIDALERKQKGKRPSMTGSFEIESKGGFPIEIAKSKNPQEYLQMVVEEFLEQTELESDFIENFIKNNPDLDEKHKKMMMRIVATQVGPWMVKDNVEKVEQDEYRVAVYSQNAISYYYNHISGEVLKKEFIDPFIINNPSLEERAKTFMLKIVESQKGPWNIEGGVTKVDQEGNKIIVYGRSSESYFYL